MKTTIAIALACFGLLACETLGQSFGLETRVIGGVRSGNTWMVEAGGSLDLEVDIPAPGGNLAINARLSSGSAITMTALAAPGTFRRRFELPPGSAGQKITLDVFMLGLDGAVYRSSGLDLLLVDTLPPSMPTAAPAGPVTMSAAPRREKPAVV